MPLHLNIALSPVQFFQVHWSEVPLAYALMQLKLWFLAGQDMTNALLGDGVIGDTNGVPRSVFTPIGIVEVVDSDVVDIVVVDVVFVEFVEAASATTPYA